MDFAFLQSILRSSYFPPTDPWLAGASLPYYYGGQLVVAILTLISRVPSSISYNLANFSCASFVIASKAGWVLFHARSVNELCRIFSTSLLTWSK